MNYKVKSANIVFLCTVLLSIFGGYFVMAFFSGIKGIFDIVGLDSKIILDIYDGLQDNSCFLILLSQGILILPSVLFLIFSREKIVLRVNKINFFSVILLVVFSYMIMPLMTFINLVSMLFVKNEITETVQDMMTETSLPILILLVGILPGICEEFVYRGILFNSHKKAGLTKAILLSGLMFGLIHMNLNQFAYAFVMGIIFAIVVEVTDSILSTMIIHFVINSSSVVTSYIYTYLQSLPQYSDSMISDTDIIQESGVTNIFTIMFYGVVAFFSTIIAGLILYVIAILCKRKHVFKEILDFDNKKKVVDLPLIIGIVISFFVMIIREFS